MIRTVIFLLLASFLATSVFAMANAGSVHAQQTTPFQSDPSASFQSDPSASSDAYLLGEATGNAFGVRDGTLQGDSDYLSDIGFDSSRSYIAPSQEYVCPVYEDFYDIPCDTSSTQFLDFSNGFYAGYESGYLYGYISGYYLSREILGTLL
jgi:hypothetical protein